MIPGNGSRQVESAVHENEADRALQLLLLLLPPVPGRQPALQLLTNSLRIGSLYSPFQLRKFLG
jgi:hypothetical protein